MSATSTGTMTAVSDQATKPIVPNGQPKGAVPPRPEVAAVTSSTCRHVDAVLSDIQSKDAKLRMAAQFAIKLNQDAALPTKKRKAPVACSQCHHFTSRMALCLSCGHSYCHSVPISTASTSHSHHSAAHAAQKGHNLVLDLRTRQIYCHACKDYVYHPLIARVLESPLASVAALTSARPPRGIRNLGQTCYMSVVLQSLFHNVPLRNYFLRDLHNRNRCAIVDCFACEVDRLFESAFAKNAAPLAPTHFLKTFWSAANDLAGYAQQDAHEFFISLINLLHSSLPGCSERDCSCIVHSTFSGRLASRVQCGKCGNVTTSSDPFLDLNLDLKGQSTLLGCLDRYTTKESLPQGQYACSKCSSSPDANSNSTPSTKQLSLEKLPPVLTIQLKRFEHLPNGSVKMDSPVQFPLSLDLAPYLSDSTTSLTDSRHLYRLQSVIEHEGQLNNGHYRAYISGPDDWYVLDDDKVKNVPISLVKRVKPYLLTYMRASP